MLFPQYLTSELKPQSKVKYADLRFDDNKLVE